MAKRVVAPDSALAEVDGSGGRAYRQADGTFHLNDRDAKQLVAYGGFYKPDMGMGRRAEGYRCESCGFGTWFTTCSRCGGNCSREV